MKIVVDGNDGTGKTTLVKALLEAGFDAYDRGIPTRLTDRLAGDPDLEIPDDEIYIILDAPVAICQQRLQKAGRNLSEAYHNIEDLTCYRQRFIEVARSLPRCYLIDVSSCDAQGAFMLVQQILTPINN